MNGQLPAFFMTPYGTELILAATTLQGLLQTVEARTGSSEIAREAGNAYCFLRSKNEARTKAGFAPLDRRKAIEAIAGSGGYQPNLQYRYRAKPTLPEDLATWVGVQTITPAFGFYYGCNEPIKIPVDRWLATPWLVGKNGISTITGVNSYYQSSLFSEEFSFFEGDPGVIPTASDSAISRLYDGSLALSVEIHEGSVCLVERDSFKSTSQTILHRPENHLPELWQVAVIENTSFVKRGVTEQLRVILRSDLLRQASREVGRCWYSISVEQPADRGRPQVAIEVSVRWGIEADLSLCLEIPQIVIKVGKEREFRAPTIQDRSFLFMAELKSLCDLFRETKPTLAQILSSSFFLRPAEESMPRLLAEALFKHEAVVKLVEAIDPPLRAWQAKPRRRPAQQGIRKVKVSPARLDETNDLFLVP